MKFGCLRRIRLGSLFLSLYLYRSIHNTQIAQMEFSCERVCLFNRLIYEPKRCACKHRRKKSKRSTLPLWAELRIEEITFTKNTTPYNTQTKPRNARTQHTYTIYRRNTAGWRSKASVFIFIITNWLVCVHHHERTRAWNQG